MKFLKHFNNYVEQLQYLSNYNVIDQEYYNSTGEEIYFVSIIEKK